MPGLRRAEIRAAFEELLILRTSLFRQSPGNVAPWSSPARLRSELACQEDSLLWGIYSFFFFLLKERRKKAKGKASTMDFGACRAASCVGVPGRPGAAGCLGGLEARHVLLRCVLFI